MPFCISGLLIDNKHGLAMMPMLVMLIMPFPNPMANTVAPAYGNYQHSQQKYPTDPFHLTALHEVASS
jgi:hypothetical protein